MTKSTHAAVAQIIRSQLKKHGIPGRVRSESGTLSSSVRVSLENPTPWTAAAVREFASEYKAGHFDGMTDCYEYSNRRRDIPQVEFIFVESEFSDDLKQAAYDYLRANFSGFDDAPASHHDAHSFYNQQWGEWAGTMVWQVLNGSMDDRTKRTKFWHKPRIRTAA